MRPLLVILPALFALAACGGGGADPLTPIPSTAPPGAPLSALPCLNQAVGPGQRSVANLVVPDTIKLDFTKPSGFPNGRRLTDSVIDTELAWLFIDLTKHPANVLASRPLGPQANDVPFRSDFPYLAPPQGNPPPPPAGADFNFRTDAPSAYVQVDRMGMPAISTVVIGSSKKLSYNDDSPAVDGTLKYVNEISTTLGGLANALADDWQKLGLAVCAKP
ncbi:DUF4331 family protein [Phenylobacterium sp.]|uniref:DUF4331 family protein n=1 Tax=Phenylobacterium sp. TaxID=1871053 RepID=UPI0025E3D789|nr:DUF4331 family protein [Phenylobacterium sp.]